MQRRGAWQICHFLVADVAAAFSLVECFDALLEMVILAVQYPHQVIIRFPHHGNHRSTGTVIIAFDPVQKLPAQPSPPCVPFPLQEIQLLLRNLRILLLDQLFQNASILKDCAPPHKVFQHGHRVLSDVKAVGLQIKACTQVGHEFSLFMGACYVILGNVLIGGVLPQPLGKFLFGYGLMRCKQLVHDALFQGRITDHLAFHLDTVQLIQHPAHPAPDTLHTAANEEAAHLLPEGRCSGWSSAE